MFLLLFLILRLQYLKKMPGRSNYAVANRQNDSSFKLEDLTTKKRKCHWIYWVIFAVLQAAFLVLILAGMSPSNFLLMFYVINST